MNVLYSDQLRVCSSHHSWLRIILSLTMLALVGFAGVRAAPATPAAALVKEINLTERRFEGLAWATDLVATDNRVFFRSGDPENGNELWVTDGTAAGTQLVYDIEPGMENSSFLEMLSVGERLFFTSAGQETPFGLWVSDGATAGTVRLSDSLINPEQLTNVGGIVFFIALNRQGAQGLWRSDGTAAGTVQLIEFETIGVSSPANLTNVAGKLFFIASDAAHGRELWVSDGTTIGTRIVADLNPDGDSFAQSESPELTAVGNTLYFITTADPPLLYQLWRSDGTAAGTQRVTSAGPIELTGAAELENVAGTLYFHGLGRVDDTTWSNGLWKSDGSAPGTVEVKSFSTDSEALTDVPARLIGTSSQLFFVGPDSTLWRSDGTPSGTLQIDGVSVDESSFTGVADASGGLFFAGADASGDIELWLSDGTAGGSRRVRDINAAGSSSPCCLAKLGDMVLFSANGGQLWRSDGTEAGTLLIKDPAIAPLGIYGYPMFGNPSYQMAGALGKLFFAADDGTHGYELWVSDGTAASTQLVKDINPSGSSVPMFLTPLGSALFFMTGDPTAFMLWKTDGTEAGTSIVRSFADSRIPFSAGLTKAGATLYFLARDSSGDKLWRSDGTANGTVPVASLPPADSFPTNLIGVNGRLFFVATDSVHGHELWTSDGTAAGTMMLKDILTGPYSSDRKPFGLSAAGGTLLFMIPRGNDYELWKSDGTTNGTVRVTALGLNSNEWVWEPADFTPVGSLLFFTTGLHIEGRPHLWVSDSTAAGTRQVNNSSGYPVADPGDMAAVNGRLLFSQNYGVYGRELWASDGTPSGTVLIKDIYPGPAGSALSGLRQIRDDGWALFAASAGPDGVELWQTDGTAAHTQQLQDLAPGASSSNPVNFVGAGGQVYFIADDGRSGPELWSLSQSIFQNLFRFKRYVPLLAR
jgi:ELWxxDGT repeat protein